MTYPLCQTSKTTLALLAFFTLNPLPMLALAESPPLVKLQFDGMNPVTQAEDKQQIRSTQSLTVNGEKQTINYHRLFATGDQNNGEIFGLVKDKNGKPLTLADGSPYICNGTNGGIGSGLDHVSILQKNDKLYMVSQYECAIGTLYLNELQQDKYGYLTVKPNTLKHIDQSSEFGGYVHCAGQTTPWQSHLASEEYEPDARAIEANFSAKTQKSGNVYYDELVKYWGDLSEANPYFYGWVPEVKITPDGSPDYQKHYSMGRFSHELGYVMPDERTVYLSDDNTNVGLFLFIADQKRDLSAGTLYAAQWQQTSAKGLGKANLRWISLGHATNQQIRKVVEQKPNFSDLFNTEQPTEDGQCSAKFFAVNTENGNECLQLKDVNKDGKINETDEVIASRLETRRMAAYKGATTEFRKGEGITFNPTANQLYVSMSEIALGMENYAKRNISTDTYDVGGGNHIKLDFNPCGGVYALAVKPNAEMQSDYVAETMAGLIAGEGEEDLSAPNGYRCKLDALANPDNISYLTDSNSLAIGEDSDLHENSVVWSYNLTDQSLTRVLSAPLDAENTSTFWHSDVNGFSYLINVAQHPNKNQMVEPMLKESQAGYLGPIRLKQSTLSTK